jgi:hypothetical protein
MYALMVLLFALALLGLARAVDGARRGWLLYAIATALLTLSHGIRVAYALVAASVFWVLAPAEHRRTLAAR